MPMLDQDCVEGPICQKSFCARAKREAVCSSRDLFTDERRRVVPGHRCRSGDVRSYPRGRTEPSFAQKLRGRLGQTARRRVWLRLFIICLAPGGVIASNRKKTQVFIARKYCGQAATEPAEGCGHQAPAPVQALTTSAGAWTFVHDQRLRVGRFRVPKRGR